MSKTIYVETSAWDDDGNRTEAQVEYTERSAQRAIKPAWDFHSKMLAKNRIDAYPFQPEIKGEAMPIETEAAWIAGIICTPPPAFEAPAHLPPIGTGVRRGKLWQR